MTSTMNKCEEEPLNQGNDKKEYSVSSEENVAMNRALVANLGSFPAADRRSLTSEFTSYSETSSAFNSAVGFIVIYLLVGTLSFRFVFKNLSIIEALYFSVVTSTSCGYGDYFAEGNWEKVYLIFYIIVGVCGLGIGMGIIGERVINLRKKENEQQQARSQKKLIEMFTETDNLESLNENLEETPFEAIKSICIGNGPFVLLIAAIALVIGYFEGWDIVTSLYFCVVTTTTVGYGDVTPKTPAMQLLCVFYLPISIAVMANFLESVADAYMKRQAKKAEQEFLHRSLTLRDIFEMDEDKDGEVDLGEFLSYMLVAMGKVDKNNIEELKNLFDKLDVNQSGQIQKKDLVLRSEPNKQKSHVD